MRRPPRSHEAGRRRAPRGETVLGFARRALYDLARLGLLYARDGTWVGTKPLIGGVA